MDLGKADRGSGGGKEMRTTGARKGKGNGADADTVSVQKQLTTLSCCVAVNFQHVEHLISSRPSAYNHSVCDQCSLCGTY